MKWQKSGLLALFIEQLVQVHLLSLYNPHVKCQIVDRHIPGGGFIH
jgi:hypothetical protein